MSATAVTAAGDGGDRVFFGSHCAARLLGKPVRGAAQRRREQAERTARYTAQRETERVEAMAVGFYADLDGINAYVLARACVRFASDPHLIASRRAGLPERDRAHPRGEGGHER